jgi:hypothetical protein
LVVDDARLVVDDARLVVVERLRVAVPCFFGCGMAGSVGLLHRKFA